MYFRAFPKLLYSFDNKEFHLLTDILRRVTINSKYKDTYVYYDEYLILDGDTPEMIADKHYGNPELHWVIFLVNEIVDPRYEWPLDQNTLVEFCKDKYGEDEIYSVHHYENTKGQWVNPTYSPTPQAVTNFQFEDAENEKKRPIKLLKPAFISDFVAEFEGLVTR